jgi:hypothetical protein
MTVLAAATPLDTAGETEWRDWRWKHRVLVDLAPEKSRPPTWGTAAAMAGASERALLLRRVADAEAGAALRRRWGLAPSTRVVLIGLDGGVKAAYEQWPLPGAVFRVIDAMPMRRQQMEERVPP